MMTAHAHHPFTSRPRHSRGFTTVAALVLIGMVGIALASLTTLFAVQAKRTRTVQIHAQLRQLLEIGAQSSVHSLNQPSAKLTTVVPLPASLTGANLKVDVKSATPTTQVLLISATLKDLSHSQTVTLANQNNHWQITNATLEK